MFYTNTCSLSRVGDHLDPELAGEPGAAGRRDDERSVGRRPLHPTAREQPGEERRAQPAAQVVAPLAPVEAVPDQPAATGKRVDVDPEREEAVAARVRQEVLLL